MTHARFAAFLVLMLVAPAFAVAGSAAAGETPASPPQTSPSDPDEREPHLDTLPPMTGDFLPTSPLADPTWIAVPILRARLDGTSVPAFYVFQAHDAEAAREALAQADVPALPLSATAALSNEDIAAQGVAEDVAEAFADLFAPRPMHTITDSTTLMLAVYHDKHLIDSGLTGYADVSWTQTVSVLQNDVTIPLNRYTVVRESGMQTNVATDCHMQEAAAFEVGFARAAVGIVIYSPGTVTVSGYGEANGYANNGPVTRILRWGESGDDCVGNGAKRTPAYIPQAYVNVDANTIVYYPRMMDNDKSIATYVSAHEVAHLFDADHEDARCWGDWQPFHTHKTLEAFTGGSDTPTSCTVNYDPYGHFHWYFSDAGRAAMRAERTRYTGCHNANWCTYDATPAAVSVSAVAGNGQITLSWSEPANGGNAIDFYLIFRGSGDNFQGGGYHAWTGNGQFSWTDTGLTNGQTYWYYIRAQNDVGWGPRGNYVGATPASSPGSPTLNSATGGNGFVDLSWSPPGSNGGSPVTSYNVYRATCSFCHGSTPYASGITSTSWRDNGVTNGQTYFYRMAAVNAVGTSAMGNERSATPVGPPSAPTLNSATGGNGFVDLSWSAPGSNGGSAITSYNVYRAACSNCQGGTPYASGISAGATTWRDNGVTNGQTYFYRMAAVNGAGTSAQSNERSATPQNSATVPSAPALNSATGGNGFVDLAWSAPSSNGGSAITSYSVYRATCSNCQGGTPYATGISASATTWRDNGVTNGQAYFYKLAAVNGVGTGAQSNERSATPSAPPAPANDNIGSATTGSGLSWVPASQSTSGATLQASELRPCNMGTATVWFRFTPSGTGTYRIKTEGSSYDTVLAVYASSTLGSAHMACNDDAIGTASSVDVALTNGVSYWIQAGGFSDGRTGTLQLNVAILPPANDNIASATTLSNGGSVSQNTAGATLQASEQRPCNMGTSTVWYRFTPGTTGTYRIKTEGSDFDTVLGIYTSSTLGSAAASCNDDNGAGGLWSKIETGMSGGTTYWIQVGGYSDGRTGNVQVSASYIGGL